jgi:ParB family chromosome partitioning protein
MAFDLSSVLRDVSNLDTPEEQITRLPLDLLDPDPDNFYSLDGLEELAGNIETVGLLDPIRVRPAGDRYIVVSGHRRRAACMLIRDGGSAQFKDGVPCIIELGEASDALRRLRLIYANSSTRQLSAAELSRQAEEVTRILYELKEQGMEFSGRMRDHVAEACRLSKTKIGRLHAIRANCINYVLDAFDEGKINESVAYEFSRLDKALQHRIYTNHLRLGYKLEALTADYIQQMASTYQKLITIRCPKTETGLRCVYAEGHFDEAQRLSHFEHVTESCTKGRCCLKCPSLSTCENACLKCEPERQQQLATADRLKQAREVEIALEQKARENARKLHDEETAGIWARIRTAAETTGRDLERVLDELCECDADVQEALRFCRGEEKDVNHLAMDLLDDCLIDLADGLGCSVDYLLGRTSAVLPVTFTSPAPSWAPPAAAELQNLPTEPRWISGTPTRVGRYFVRAKGNMDADDEPPKEFRFDWDGETWYFAGRPIFKGWNVLDWWPLPDLED